MRWRSNTVGGPGTGLPSNAGTAKSAFWGRAQNNSIWCLQQSSKGSFASSRGGRLSESVSAEVLVLHIREWKSSQDFSARPHCHPPQTHWKLLFSHIWLTPCSSHRCSMTSWLSEPPQQILWGLAGRKLIPLFVLGKETSGCLADMGHGTHSRQRRETKNRTIAGLQPATLCLDNAVENLRLWEERLGLGSPVLHTQPHCPGGSPLLCPRRANRQTKVSASSACTSSHPAKRLSEKQPQWDRVLGSGTSVWDTRIDVETNGGWNT